jgi:hypothetical protein
LAIRDTDLSVEIIANCLIFVFVIDTSTTVYCIYHLLILASDDIARAVLFTFLYFLDLNSILTVYIIIYEIRLSRLGSKEEAGWLAG